MARENIIFPLAALAIGFLLLEAYRRSTQGTSGLYPDATFDTGTPPAPMSATTLFHSTVPFMQYEPQTMNSSAAGLQNIINWEGKRNQAYLDSAGKLTIGIGHLIVPGDGLDANSTITDATMNAIFANDIDQAEINVKRNVKVPLTQGQFDALVDFTFQFGNQLYGSHLLLLLNSGDYRGAANELSRWVHVNGVVSNQLVARRQAATTMFG